MVLAMSALTLGLPEAITYYVARGVGAPGAILRRGILYLSIVGVFGSLIIVLIASLLTQGAPGTVRTLISVAACFLVPTLIMGAIRGAAAGLQAWGVIAAERLVGAVGKLAAIIVLLLMGSLTPLTATICIAVGNFAGIVVYVVLIGKKNRVRMRSGAGLRSTELLGFGARMWFGSLAGVLLSRLDQTLMIPLSNTYQLGLYAVAVSISEVALVFNSAVRDVMFARESASRQDSRLGLASRLSTMLTFALATAIAVASVKGIPILFGSDFAGAVLPTILLLIAVFAGNPGSVAGAGLSARGRPGLRSLSLVIAVVFNVAAFICLVPTLGAVGAALATLVGNLVAGYLNIVWLRVFFAIPVRDFLCVRRSDFSEIRRITARIIRR